MCGLLSGQLGPAPMRVPDAESVVEGSEPSAALLEEAAAKVTENVEPRDDHRAGGRLSEAGERSAGPARLGDLPAERWRFRRRGGLNA